MKCYFDENLEAQGLCTQCGRFANKAYSQILDGKFVCVECAFGGISGVLDWLRREIERTRDGECGLCQRYLFHWPRNPEFDLLYSIVPGAQRDALRFQYSLFHQSGCTKTCLCCDEHKEEYEIEPWPSTTSHQTCRVCGEKRLTSSYQHPEGMGDAI